MKLVGHIKVLGGPYVSRGPDVDLLYAVHRYEHHISNWIKAARKMLVKLNFSKVRFPSLNDESSISSPNKLNVSHTAACHCRVFPATQKIVLNKNKTKMF